MNNVNLNSGQILRKSPETLVRRNQMKRGLTTERYWTPLKADEEAK